MKKKRLISIDVSMGSYPEFVSTLLANASLPNKSSYVCVANVHMLVEAHKSSSFAGVVNNASIVTPDGKPLTWAFRLLYGIKQDRVAGMDILPDMLSGAVAQQLPVYFYGGTDEMLALTNQYLVKNYPALKVAGMYSPPFRPLSADEKATIITNINQSGAAIVFVVLGCPKQELWMASMNEKINSLMIGIGGALPVLIGMQSRAPKWMQKAGLEWLYRLCQEPRRLFKRYVTTNSIFIYLLFKEKLFPQKIKKAG